MLSVAVVSCAYGLRAHRFFPGWWEAVQQLNPAPDRVVVASDGTRPIVGPSVAVTDCPAQHPQAWYLDLAITLADTEWVWIVDIDDFAISDGLAGLDGVDADVWQMGYKRSDGEVYLPPRLTNAEYLASERNVYVAGSAFRTEAFRDCGGFPDVALQDWALWRRMAANGARFEPSTRAHFHYQRHPYTRGETELTLDRRAGHLAEMEAALVA